MSAYRNERAFVLLGDPGAGKTTEFKQAAQSEDGVWISARRFIREARRRPKWRHKTLFIDGLDEVRAGDRDPHRPLDHILERLGVLGWPRVRLSCRPTAWLAGDHDELRTVAGYERLPVLRLNPLATTAVKQLLAEHSVPDVDGFVTTADERGLGELLSHPLALGLLAKAFATGRGWPANKLETYEAACRKLAEEHNRQHREANRVPGSLDDTIAAAGFLTLLFLVGGKERIKTVGAPRSHTDSDLNQSLRLEDIPAVALPHGNMSALVHALGTRLFSSIDGGVVPVHRNVAEYIGAKHLHGRIDGGVPVGRVLALLAGADGIVAPTLRGLAAWLATLNPEARPRLVEQAPLDVLTAGDPSVFPSGGKRRLLHALAQLPSRRGFMLRQTSPSVRSSMASSDTIEFLRSCIATNDPETQPQSVVELLFEGLASDPSPHLLVSAREAVAVARDRRWMPAVRSQALAVAIRMAEHDDEGYGLLAAMLQDVSAGRVRDTSQVLRGKLLEGLYPRHLEPAEIRTLLPRAVAPNLWYLLSRALVVKTDDSRVPDVLDALCSVDQDQRDADYPDLFGAVSEDAYLKLLDRGLQLHSDSIAVGRLYDWLAVHPEPGHRLSVQESISPVEPWLSRRPRIRRALLREHVKRGRRLRDEAERGNPPLDDGRTHFRMSRLLFVGMSFGETIAVCFDEALAAAATSLDDARRYLDLAVARRRSQLQPPPGTTFAEALTSDWIAWASSQLKGKSELVEHLERLAAREAEQLRTSATRDGPYRELARQAALRRREALVGGDVPTSKSNSSPELLEEIALAYLGIRPMEPSLQPIERLQKWLAADAWAGDDASEAVERALRLLSEVARKSDLPSLAQLLESERHSRMARSAYPVLAGLDHLGQRDNAVPQAFSDDRLRSMLGLHYLTVVLDKQTPAWVRSLLNEKPELAAETLIATLTAQIRSGREYEDHHLHVLDSPRDSAVLKRAVPALLDAFPARGNARYLVKLRPLLEVALRHLPKDQLREVVERKLSFGSMDTAQQAAWLGIGLRTRAHEFVGQSLRYLADKRDPTVVHLAHAWAAGNRHTRFSPVRAGVGGTFALVRRFGRRYSPEWVSRRTLIESDRATIVSEEEQVHERASRLLMDCIRYLSRQPRRSAGGALRRLAEDPDLAAWHDELENARAEQTDARRRASHRPPSLADIGQVLGGGPPTSASDLAECVADQLRRLKREVRDSNADGWRPFWNEGEHGRPTTRKPENSCRGELLRALRLRLGPMSIDVQPEPQYAGGKRADIRASAPGGDPAIPIELKMSYSREVWSAAENQLVKKYARDPASHGHGVYVVLWLGKDCMMPMRGRRPKSADEMEERLWEQLSPSQRGLVRVVVIDVTPP